jgi:ABC-2 type transport system permease protein
VSGSRTVLLVAGREIRQRARSRALIVITLVFAAILTILALLPNLLAGAFLSSLGEGETAASAPAVGVLGGPNEAEDPDPAVLAALTSALGQEPRLVAVADESAVPAILADEVVTFVIDPAGTRLLIPAGSGPFGPTVPASVAEALGLVQEIDRSEVDPAIVDDLLAAPPAEVEVVATQPGSSPEDGPIRYAVAYIGSLLLYFFLAFFANLVITGVIEEKSSRVVELLLPAVPPRTLMAGKVLGLGTVGTVQSAVMIVPAALVLAVTQGDQVPPELFAAIAAVVGAFVLSFGLYAGVAAGMSAMVSRVEDSQVALMPLYAVLIVAFGATFPVLSRPDSLLAQVTTFVPFTAPFVVPARIALVALPWWQVALAAVSVVVTAVALTALAARLYEGAILRSGARVTMRSAWRGARDR